VPPVLVVGLGNPGPAYAATRHNLGARTVRLLADRHHVRLEPDPAGALAGRLAPGQSGASPGRRRADPAGRAGGGPGTVYLAIPQTAMNHSGPMVRALAGRLGLTEPRRLIVVHDELDLPAGRLKVKVGGGTAGHKGVRSIVEALGSADFVRVRIGIGKPPSSAAGMDYVLSVPDPAVGERLEAMTGVAADAVESILAEGADAAMTRFNTRGG
jgi:peptidyl-tRNA hydrolase, PTH1 family